MNICLSCHFNFHGFAKDRRLRCRRHSLDLLLFLASPVKSRERVDDVIFRGGNVITARKWDCTLSGQGQISAHRLFPRRIQSGSRWVVDRSVSAKPFLLSDSNLWQPMCFLETWYTCSLTSITCDADCQHTNLPWTCIASTPHHANFWTVQDPDWEKPEFMFFPLPFPKNLLDKKSYFPAKQEQRQQHQQHGEVCALLRSMWISYFLCPGVFLSDHRELVACFKENGGQLYVDVLAFLLKISKRLLQKKMTRPSMWAFRNLHDETSRKR